MYLTSSVEESVLARYAMDLIANITLGCKACHGQKLICLESTKRSKKKLITLTPGVIVVDDDDDDDMVDEALLDNTARCSRE